jgi:DNA-binding CsgD family transcriptional regulator
VAAKLDIGYHTVNDNIKAIYRKLGIHTRAQAAAEASRRGLVAA